MNMLLYTTFPIKHDSIRYEISFSQPIFNIKDIQLKYKNLKTILFS